MTDEPTCGTGLAASAPLPATMGQVAGGVANVLEHHMHALDLADDDARQEHAAYAKLVEAHRQVARDLAATAQQMADARDLPMGRHDMQVMSDPKAVEVFRSLVEAEQRLLDLLEQRAEEHRQMLADMTAPQTEH